ncbi:hypothetical protein SAMN06272765_5677 [Streptomyces sp. Ag109_G2-15]|nr:hypothetical protein SAMN06272765_5677 [Streptomyces sp. Ag109_G2-15]
MVGPSKHPHHAHPSAAPHRAPAAPPVTNRPPAPPAHPQPHPHPDHPRKPRVDLPDVAQPVPKAPDVCALGKEYGGWRGDSPEAVICEQTYGH